ncbi:DNA-packaging protein [Paenibacillus lautus]|uniref:DNA-packaging protein n=1 Tax=Paenibacillus lautus TaxID=1401 RepID=UPI003D2A1FD7
MTLQEQEAEVLNIIKSRWEIMDDTKDKFIYSYIQEIGRRILHYCQRKDIPEDLNWVWASMVMDALKVEMPKQFGGGDSAAGFNIKIGDTSIAPASSSKTGLTSTSKSVIDQVVLNYLVDLRRWRKMRW